jgi:hypothetical protein
MTHPEPGPAKRLPFPPLSLTIMADAERPDAQADQAPRLRGDEGEDPIVAALDFLRGGPPGDGPLSGQTSLARQKARLQEWAEGLGLLLEGAGIAARLVRGGQEHDVFAEGDRFFKVTRSGVFGLAPGIDLALVPADQDARRFHLWEATPWEYLERLRLQNLIPPGLNRLEGVIAHEDTLARGETLSVVRTTRTTSRVLT